MNQPKQGGRMRLPATIAVIFLTSTLLSFIPGRKPAGPPHALLTTHHSPPDTTPVSISFSFTLPVTARTSAGVFAADSTLVRTLWSGVTYNSGTHQATWDGLTDEGQLAGDGSYYIKVLSNNVAYTWEGTIGNNSDADTGPTVQRGYDKISGMTVVGQTAYYCKNYSEGNPSQLKLNTATPRSRIQLMPAGEGTGQATNFVASDGNYVYWAGADTRATVPYYFVFATRVSNDSEVFFPAGRAYKARVGRTYGGAIDTINNANGVVSGLAVQPSGNLLFVAHRVLNELHVLNKTTGAVVQTWSYTDAGALAVDSANYLYMAYTSGGSPRVEKFSVDTSGALTSTGIVLSGLVAPLAIAAAPDNQTVVVADGGASQQLKAFNSNTGAAVWTYGQAGGYANGPAVSNDKFYWSETRGVLGSFLAFQPDGSFWVGDAGNNRAQHFNSSRIFLDNIIYIPHHYSSFVDPNNSTRVFADYLEYQVDYSKPLGHNNGSWTLVRNWGHNVPTTHDDHNQRFRGLATLSNGRTYAMLLYKVTAQTSKWEIVELPATGNLRFTGVFVPFDNTQMTHLYPDGSLRKQTRITAQGQITTWSKRTLTGFNATFNPVWSSDTVQATTPPATAWDPGYVGITTKIKPGEVTASNIILSFDGGKALAGFDNFHLGGVKLGTNKWLWRTAMGTHPDYTGPFPATGDYDIGNNVLYAGVPAMALGRHIIWGYHGEFWKNSQTNKWNHVYDNGLFVGQFGTTGPEVTGQEAAAGMAGNAYCANIVKVGDTVYLYHNDEGHHSGLHRWRITGLNTIQQQTVPVTLAADGHGLLASYYDGPQLNNVYHRLSRIDSTVHIDHSSVGLADTTKYSVSWTGYLQPQYNETYRLYTNTDEGVRLWVNGKLLVNKKDTTAAAEYSDTLVLKAGLRYPVRMEFFQRSGSAAASLSWSSASQAKQPIPYSRLYPATMPDYSGGYDLLENLRFHTVLEQEIYGWSRNPVAEDYTNQYTQWRNFETNIKTNVRKGSPDLSLKYVNKTAATSFVTRDLGQVATDPAGGWQLEGRVIYENNAPNEDAINLGPTGKAGSFLEVLDDSAKVILRLFWNMGYGSNLCRLYANGQVMASGTAAAMSAIYNASQPISIIWTGDSCTVQYGPFAAVRTARFDATSRGYRAKTLRWYAWTINFNSGRAIDIEKMKFMSVPANQNNQSTEQRQQLLVQDLFGKQEQPGALKVYPNPSNGTTLYIRYAEQQASMLKVRVTDLSGKELQTRYFPANPQGVYSLRFQHRLAPGVYLVVVNDRMAEKLAVY